jgi:tetratricopeptide (TPR) repeat protein
MYFYLAFLPHGLAPFYPATALHIFQVLWAAALLLGVSWLVWKFREGRPYLMMGWLWFLSTLVPVIGLIQVGSQARADRYMYIPLLGILVALAWCAQDLLRLKSGSAFWGSAAVGVAMIALSWATWTQVGHWRSSYDLWTHALQVTRSNFVAEENLAVSLLDLGREDEAFPHFERVTALQPDDAVALLNGGNYLEKQGHYEDAIEKFQHVLRVTHDPEKLTGAYRGLGVAYAQLGDRANARANFLHALQLSPENPTELYNLSLLEIRDGIDNLTRTVSLKPTPEGYLQLGQLLKEDQRTGDAQLAYEKALRLNPKLSAARQALRDLKQSNE